MYRLRDLLLQLFKFGEDVAIEGLLIVLVLEDHIAILLELRHIFAGATEPAIERVDLLARRHHTDVSHALLAGQSRALCERRLGFVGVRIFGYLARLQFGDHDHTVVVLRELKGLSYNEIAEITRISLDNVKTRLSRARAMLRRKLEHYYRS